MARKAFYSFHYKPDNWRVGQVRNIGTVTGNSPASDNDWETVTKGGDSKIKKWINDQMDGRTCSVVLIGQNTAKRKWINYEIKRSWSENMGIVGIHIHNLKNSNGDQASKGSNPFSSFNVGDVSMSKICKTYDPPYSKSQNVYSHIEDNIEDWIEEAIQIRKNN